MITQEEYILFDLIFERLPINTPFTFSGMYHDLLSHKYDRFSDETIVKLNQLLISISFNPRKFFLDNEYIECVGWQYPKDKLTEKGKKAKELGGHLKYKEWEEKQRRAQKIEEFPKKKWYFYEPLKTIFTVLLTAVLTVPISYLTGKKAATHNSPIKNPQYTPIKPLKAKEPKLPKTLNKKDTAL